MTARIFCFLLLIAALPVQAGDVGSAYISPTAEVRVQLTPQDQAVILSRMTGVVADINFRDGDSVKKGDLILRFECAEREQSAAQALARKKKQDSMAQSASRLAELGSGSTLDRQVRVAEKAEADASYQLATVQAKYCRVLAPFDGRISVLNVRPYQTVRENDQIAEVIQDTTLEAEMIVPSRWLSWLKPGLVFNVKIDETGGTYPAVISHLGGRVDPVSQSIKAYARIDDRPTELLAGMSGIADLQPPAPQTQARPNE